jgi:hypothetical protein
MHMQVTDRGVVAPEVTSRHTVTRRFARYDVGLHLAQPSDTHAAWLTGQNSFRHSTLSPSESAVLDELATVGYEPLHCGFPYNADAVDLPFRKEPVIPAAWRCVAQYAAATHSERFAHEVARHLQPLFDATSRHLLLLVGSCGAQMLGAARPLLRVPDGLNVHVLALGPVGRLPQHPVAQVLRGRWDVLSHTLSRAPGRVVPCGHLGYLEEPEVRSAIRDFAARTLR